MSHYGGHWIREKRRLAIYVRDGFRCVYCGRTAKDKGATYWWGKRTGPTRLAIDHVIARECGGSHSHTNLVTCCRGCNDSKGTKDLYDWLGSLVAAGRIKASKATEIGLRVRRQLAADLNTRMAEAMAAWLDSEPANDRGG